MQNEIINIIPSIYNLCLIDPLNDGAANIRPVNLFRDGDEPDL